MLRASIINLCDQQRKRSNNKTWFGWPMVRFDDFSLLYFVLYFNEFLCKNSFSSTITTSVFFPLFARMVSDPNRDRVLVWMEVEVGTTCMYVHMSHNINANHDVCVLLNGYACHHQTFYMPKSIETYIRCLNSFTYIQKLLELKK